MRRTVTATFAVFYLGQVGQASVQVATIRKWASLGEITRTGRDMRGRVLYDLDTITRYAQQIGRVGSGVC